MPVDRRIEFRVGVHEGNIVVEDQHIFGDGLFEPGRLRLATNPLSTGLAAVANTIGIVVVAALAATIAGVLPGAAITFTPRLTKSAANAGNRS